jgi:hypothetical protein
MKTKSILAMMALAICVSFGVQAQSMALVSGTFKALSGQTEVNVAYKYDGMKVGKGKKAIPEDEYIERKKGEYNKKEAGRGDSWEKDWTADRENKFHVKFEELLNKGMKGMAFGRGNYSA